MRSRALVMDGNATQLSAAMGGDDACRSVTLQNPTGNDAVSWGAYEAQPMTLAAGDMISIPITSLKNLWFNGTNTEIINSTICG